MDQQAFRQLLQTPRPGASQSAAASSSSSSSLPPRSTQATSSAPHAASSQQRRFGLVNKRRVQPSAGSEASSLEELAGADGGVDPLRPRSVKAGPGGGGPSSKSSRDAKSPNAQQQQQQSASLEQRQRNSATGEAYLDRAEARRRGVLDQDERFNEFREVERLREEWQARLDAARDDEEREKLQQQMAYLGGDAKHSVLVKGLDFALLEQQKAKASASLEAQQGARDEDLEALYEGRGDATAQGNGKDGQAKTNRDRLVEELKRKRIGRDQDPVEQQQSASDDARARQDELERAKRSGKFRPINANAARIAGGGRVLSRGERDALDRMGVRLPHATATSQGFATGGSDEGRPEFIWKDGKRMRRKKKKSTAEDEKGVTDVGADAQGNGVSESTNGLSEAPGETSSDSTAAKERNAAGEAASEGSRRLKDAGVAAVEQAAQKPDDVVEKGMRPGIASGLTSRHGAVRKEDLQPPPVDTKPDPEKTATEPGPQEADPGDIGDIFSDAGSWHGLEEFEDEEKASRDAARADKAGATGKSAGVDTKRDWFGSSRGGDGADDEAHKDDGSVQRQVEALLGRVKRDVAEKSEAAHVAPAQEGAGRAGTRASAEGEAESAKSRLEQLESSSLSNEAVRALLEREEERERKRAERGQSGGERGKHKRRRK